jgi:hypothetical protein
VLAAIANGHTPSAIKVPDDRFARANVRIALRQVRAASGATGALAPWLAAHDQSQAEMAEADDAEAMHGAPPS